MLEAFGTIGNYMPFLLLAIAFIGGYQYGVSVCAKENYKNSLVLRSMAGEKMDEASRLLNKVREHEQEFNKLNEQA